MTSWQERQYPSKILLFGEYTVILDSGALAVPFPKLFGRWELGSFRKSKSISNLYDYLVDKSNSNLLEQFNIKALKLALSQGYDFNSSIPVGYGMGSSGALTAGIFDIIREGKSPPDDIRLKEILALIESFFHGTSSGLDPLVSWLGKGVELQGKGIFQIIDQWTYPSNNYYLFLMDTGIKRKTATYVDIFKKKLESNPKFKATLNDLSLWNDKAISLFKTKNENELFETFTQISEFQKKHFNEMIPDGYSELWKRGLKSNHFSLKLCGAGGGGFILGMARKDQSLPFKDKLIILD